MFLIIKPRYDERTCSTEEFLIEAKGASVLFSTNASIVFTYVAAWY
jgi:hypothetical protein